MSKNFACSNCGGNEVITKKPNAGNFIYDVVCKQCNSYIGYIVSINCDVCKVKKSAIQINNEAYCLTCCQHHFLMDSPDIFW